MPIYVDDQEWPFRNMLMCHMVGDSIEELHEMAKKIGLKREWFQDQKVPHYDLSKSKRKEAIRNGAILDTRKVVEIIREYRIERRQR